MVVGGWYASGHIPVEGPYELKSSICVRKVFNCLKNTILEKWFLQYDNLWR